MDDRRVAAETDALRGGWGHPRAVLDQGDMVRCQGQATLHGIRALPNWRGLVRWRKKPAFSWVESAAGDGHAAGI